MRWTDSPWFKSKWTAWICFTPIHWSSLKSHLYKIKKNDGARELDYGPIMLIRYNVSSVYPHMGLLNCFFSLKLSTHTYLGLYWQVFLVLYNRTIGIPLRFFAIAYGCDEHHQGILAEQHTSNLWRVQLQWSYRELQWNRALYCRHVYNHDFTSLYNCENVYLNYPKYHPANCHTNKLNCVPPMNFWLSCTRLYFTKASRK